jgi:dihydroorotate dehydrogenase
MYELISSLIGRYSVPYARQFAATTIRVSSKFKQEILPPQLTRQVLGLSFPSPIGLAAGFDKSGALYSSLPRLGFGFAEIGSVTPQPEEARSPGLEVVKSRLLRHAISRPIPLGISISMNRSTPFNQMAQDYIDCLAGVWPFADYVTLNLGVRAGPDLHLVENRAFLKQVCAAVKQEQIKLTHLHGYYRPIVIKLDHARGDLESLLDCINDFGFDGLVLCCVETHRRNLSILEHTVDRLNNEIPVISVGGIRAPSDAKDRLNAGASLLQLYTGLVISGPRLVQDINDALAAECELV